MRQPRSMTCRLKHIAARRSARSRALADEPIGACERRPHHSATAKQYCPSSSAVAPPHDDVESLLVSYSGYWMSGRPRWRRGEGRYRCAGHCISARRLQLPDHRGSEYLLAAPVPIWSYGDPVLGNSAHFDHRPGRASSHVSQFKRSSRAVALGGRLGERAAPGYSSRAACGHFHETSNFLSIGVIRVIRAAPPESAGPGPAPRTAAAPRPWPLGA